MISLQLWSPAQGQANQHSSMDGGRGVWEAPPLLRSSGNWMQPTVSYYALADLASTLRCMQTALIGLWVMRRWRDEEEEEDGKFWGCHSFCQCVANIDNTKQQL